MTSLLSTTIEPQSLCRLLRGRSEFVNTFGTVRFVIDTDAFEFYVDASPEHLPQEIAQVLTSLHGLGLEPMDDDECEPELLDDGWVRIHFVPVEPVDDSPLIPVREETGSASPGLLVAAAAVAAAWVPTLMSMAA